MFIEKLKIGKKYCSFTADGVLYDKISVEAACEARLSSGIDLEENKFNELLVRSEEILCKERLFASLASASSTEKEAVMKLKMKGFGDKAIRKAIALAKDYGYIDDAAYAKNFAAKYSGEKGARRIKYELTQKGVPEAIAAEAAESNDENDGCKIALEKYLRRSQKSDKQKIIRHLASKGFGYDTVSETIAIYEAENGDII